MPKRAFSVAKAAERNTKGAMILKIWGDCVEPTRRQHATDAHEEGCHQEGAEYRDQAIHRP